MSKITNKELIVAVENMSGALFYKYKWNGVNFKQHDQYYHHTLCWHLFSQDMLLSFYHIDVMLGGLRVALKNGFAFLSLE